MHNGPYCYRSDYLSDLKGNSEVPKKSLRTRRSAKKKTLKAPIRRSIGRPPATGPGVGRQALIEKTCELLRSIPPERITRAEVARRAKVDPSLIRYYFRERSSLLIAAAEKLIAQYSQHLEQAIASNNLDALGLLRLKINTLIDLKLTHPFFHRLILDDILPSRNQGAKQLMNKLAARNVTNYTAIVNNGVRDGSLRQVNPAFLFMAVISLCDFFLTGLPILKLAVGDAMDHENLMKQYRDFIADLLLNGIKAMPGRKAA